MGPISNLFILCPAMRMDLFSICILIKVRMEYILSYPAVKARARVL